MTPCASMNGYTVSDLPGAARRAAAILKPTSTPQSEYSRNLSLKKCYRQCFHDAQQTRMASRIYA